MRLERRHAAGKKRATVYRFPPPSGRPVRGRPAVGAVIALAAFLGSLVAATLGPLVGEMLPSPLLVLLMLIRG